MKIYRVKYEKFRKLVNPNISYVFDKTLVLFIICRKCGNIDERIFKEEERYWVVGLIK